MTPDDEYREALGEGPTLSNTEIQASLDRIVQAGEAAKTRRRVVAGGAAVVAVLIVGAVMTNIPASKKTEIAKPSITIQTMVTAPSTTLASTTTTQVAPVATLESKKISGSFSAEHLTWTGTIAVVSGLGDSSFESLINNSIRKSFDDQVAEDDSNIKRFTSPTDPIANSTFDADFKASRNDSKFLTITFSGYVNSDVSAHGDSIVWSRSFDLVGKREVSIDDLFISGSRYLIALGDQSRIALQADQNSCYDETEASTGLAADPVNFKTFTPQADGLHITFDKYQVGCGAGSTPTVIVKWSKLTPYLSPLGKQLAAGV